MSDFMAKALSHLDDNWHTGIPHAATSINAAANLLDINPNTFRTRLARNQALVMRDPNGEARSTLTFTGYHLIFNLLQDRLLRLNLGHSEVENFLATYPERIRRDIVQKGHHKAILMIQRGDERLPNLVSWHDDGLTTVNLDDIDDMTTIIPIGRMVVGIAITVQMRADPRLAEQTLAARG